ncbi:MAG: rhamnulokinase [Prevotellaceae bacterium]|jgi:rhamnulokinase|nr:rhamnulokinase [Prevotellaceae bacterium]
MATHHFLAFDLGATSGRSVLATLSDGRISLRELARFPNKPVRIGNKYFWNIYSLFEELKNGLRAAVAEGVAIDSIGIDTWGVDFAFLASDGMFAGLPRSYRDPYTEGVVEEYFAKIPGREVYRLTGIQIMNINSLFQLCAAKREGSSALKSAESILFMPDALSYLLTGKKVCEYTIASTSQLLNPLTGAFETSLLEAAGVSPSLLPARPVMPGERIGVLSESVCRECGTGAIPVVAVAGHDTASAVAAIPAENERFAFLSSGTWSLMGLELDKPVIDDRSFAMNFTNEGGAGGTTRFLKNITGMWLLEQCRKEWAASGAQLEYPEMVRAALLSEPYRSLIDADHPSFANPESMTRAIADYCAGTGQPAPENRAAYTRCIFDSLAMKYRQVLDSLKLFAPFEIEKLHVIGGGAQNKLLNRMTADLTGIPLVAGPSEATATGNALIQAMAIGALKSRDEMRATVRNSVSPETFVPVKSDAADEAYVKYLSIVSSTTK